MAEGLAGSQGRLGAMLEGQVVEQPLLKLADEHSPADRLPPDDTKHTKLVLIVVVTQAGL